MEQAKTYCVGIRRETKSNWERRTPLTPMEAKILIDKGIKVIVQPSTNRCFVSKEFENVGTTMQEDLSEADLILGVKEVLIEDMVPDKTYNI